MNAQVVAANIANANQMASIWQFGVTLVQGDMVHQADSGDEFRFRRVRRRLAGAGRPRQSVAFIPAAGARHRPSRDAAMRRSSGGWVMNRGFSARPNCATTHR